MTADWGGPGGARQNTVFGCSGPGIEIQNEGVTDLSNNLVVGNLGPGLAFVGEMAPVRSCNNWYGNGAGGMPLSVSDVHEDPLFCDVTADVVSVRSNSPVLDSTGCGRIGARGAGCEPLPSLGLRVSSPTVRSNGALHVTFTLPTMAAARLELLDLAGRRLRSREIGTLGPGEHSVDLADGESLPSGVYFVRIVQGDQSARARAVFIR